MFKSIQSYYILSFFFSFRNSYVLNLFSLVSLFLIKKVQVKTFYYSYKAIIDIHSLLTIIAFELRL